MSQAPPAGHAGGGLPPELARWIGPGEQLLWSDVARPALLGWPPRSPLGLVVLCLLASALLVGAAVAVIAWRRVSGLGAWGEAPLLLLVLGGALPFAGLLLAGLTWAEGRRRYALTRRPDGALQGYSCGARLATRFPVEEVPAVSGGERGDLDWGELEVEVLPGEARERVRVRWTDVGYPEVVMELVREGTKARDGDPPPP